MRRPEAELETMRLFNNLSSTIQTRKETKMIELYLSKVTENSETEKAGNYYARVSYKQTMRSWVRGF